MLSAMELYGGEMSSISESFFMWAGQLNARISLTEATKNCMQFSFTQPWSTFHRPSIVNDGIYQYPMASAAEGRDIRGLIGNSERTSAGHRDFYMKTAVENLELANDFQTNQSWDYDTTLEY